MKKTALALMTLIGLSATAHADYTDFMQQKEQPYVGVDYQVSRLDTDPEVTLGSLMLRAGTQFVPNLGVEVQASIGLQDDDFKSKIDGKTYTAKNKGSYGIFLRPSYALNNEVGAYALIGANYADITVEGPNFKENGYGTSFAAGAGLTYKIRANTHVSAEYMRYDSDVNALNIGLRCMF